MTHKERAERLHAETEISQSKKAIVELLIIGGITLSFYIMALIVVIIRLH